ncbi:MAG TPA: hypothetical protein VF554_11375 [Thermoanaerobaculia bacterium]|jgi:hypothetical protein
MKETSTNCPLLKEVVMLYCDACPTKKMLPLDHLVSARPCQASRYADCPLYQEAVKRLGTDVAYAEPLAVAANGSGREAP